MTSDPRVNLIFDDGAVAVQQFVSQGLHFDIILVDSTDYGIAVPLFTLQFYQALGRLLTVRFKPCLLPSLGSIVSSCQPTGVVVANVDSPSWAPDAVAAMYRKFSKVFAVTYPYQVRIPAYGPVQGVSMSWVPSRCSNQATTLAITPSCSGPIT